LPGQFQDVAQTLLHPLSLGRRLLQQLLTDAEVMGQATDVGGARAELQRLRALHELRDGLAVSGRCLDSARVPPRRHERSRVGHEQRPHEIELTRVRRSVHGGHGNPSWLPQRALCAHAE
jgi:hypothetical protein